MAVYVDNMKAPLGRMIMCHMIADTPEELRAMARALGLNKHWAQFPGTYKEHYDISKGKRLLAIELGAIPVTQKELAKRIWDRKSFTAGKQETVR